MSKLKKISFGIFVVLSLFLAVVGYNSLKQSKKPSKEVLAVLPDSCLIYCATKNFHELSRKLVSQNLIFSKWCVFDEINGLSTNLNYFDSLIYSHNELQELMFENPVHFAYYKNNKRTGWIGAFKLKELKQEAELKVFLFNLFHLKDEKFMEISKGIYLKISDGIVLFSNSEELLMLTENLKNNLIGNKSFNESIANLGNSDVMQIYINHQQLSVTTPKPIFQINSILEASESIIGANFGPDEIVFNGAYTALNNTLQSFILNQLPSTQNFYDYLPFATNSFKAIAINQPNALQQIIQKQNPEHAFWKKLNDKAAYKVDKEFYENMHTSVIEFSAFQSQMICVLVKDTLKARDFLNLIKLQDTIVDGVHISLFPTEKQINSCFTGIVKCDAKCGFILNDALYFSTNLQSAQQLALALINKSLLSLNTSFMQYANEHVNLENNLIHYVSPSASLDLVKEFTRLNVTKNISVIENLTHASLVVKNQKNKLKFRLQLNYQSTSEDIPNLLWLCKLDTMTDCKPYFFINHNTQEQEILIQDQLHQLYLINSTGKILWKKKINEEVKSEISTVDVYKNSKNQLLFNSDNYLHLIDRNGDYVAGYPKKLPAKASNALSLIDYDNDRNFRIFIACENNTIYNYNLFGVLAEGYRPYKTEDKVKLAIKFVRVGESDYLITIDDSGIIHAFSRKGVARIGFKNKAIENCQDFAIAATNNINTTFLYYVDAKNNLIDKVSFADKKDIVKLSVDLSDSKIYFQNTNDDKTPDFTAISKEGFYGFDVNGTLLQAIPGLKSSQEVSTLKFNGKRLLYAYSPEESMINYCYFGTTAVYSLPSNSVPALSNLFKDEKRYIIYSKNNQLVCHLLK